MPILRCFWKLQSLLRRKKISFIFYIKTTLFLLVLETWIPFLNLGFLSEAKEPEDTWKELPLWGACTVIATSEECQLQLISYIYSSFFFALPRVRQNRHMLELCGILWMGFSSRWMQDGHPPSLCMSSWSMHTCKCAHMQRSEEEIGCLPLLLSASLPWDRAFCWTRSLPFQLTCLAVELLGPTQLYPMMLGYRYTQPCPAFHVSARDLNLGLTCLYSEWSNLLSHFSGPVLTSWGNI